jgi:hypothetical protein
MPLMDRHAEEAASGKELVTKAERFEYIYIWKKNTAADFSAKGCGIVP